MKPPVNHAMRRAYATVGSSYMHRMGIAPVLSRMTADERQSLIDEAIQAGRITKCPSGGHQPTWGGSEYAGLGTVSRVRG